MNVSSKGAPALDGAEQTASRKLFCLKTGEEIPSGTYQRRGHFITCCGGNCKKPEVTDDDCADASCNCAEGWKIDDAPEPPHGEESAHKINNEDGNYQFPFANSDLYDSDDESNNGSASGDPEEADDQAAVEEDARFDADAEEAGDHWAQDGFELRWMPIPVKHRDWMPESLPDSGISDQSNNE